MNAFARQWDARIAPIDEPQLVRDEGEWVYESYAPTAFRGWSKREIPVLINHDPELKTVPRTS
jgi:phage head maturation protease